MADNGLGYITELTASDVLFGRGSGPNDHEGNIRFRHLVAERKQEYLATNHRQTKAKIAREIVNTILEDRGRFLKKVEHFEARRLGIPKGVDAWIIVDDDTVMEKAKQALRQNTNKGDKRGNSPTRGGEYSPQRGNSPVRGISPTRGQTSPIPGAQSPMRRQQPAPMPTFDDLEPLPLGMNNPHLARSAQQFAGMTLQQQQQAIQQQVQAQVQQQQQQITAAQLASLGVDPSALGWGGNDPNQFNPNVAAQLAAAQQQGDWGQGGQNHVLPGQDGMGNNNPQMGGGWGGQQNMAPPQPRVPGMNQIHPNQVEYSNSNLNNWNNNSENAVTSGQIGRVDDMEDSKKRRQSLQVEDLMDSFSQMKTGNFSAEAKLQESTDTMGTIEPIGAFSDSTSMSVTSFSSIFKSSMGESTDDMTFSTSRGVSRSSSINESTRSNDIDSSMQSIQSIGSLGNLSEVWGTRGMSLLDRLVQEERERANQEAGGGDDDDDNGGGAPGNGGDLATTPRPVGLMEEEPDTLAALGASSLSVMKAAFSERSGADSNDNQD